MILLIVEAPYSKFRITSMPAYVRGSQILQSENNNNFKLVEVRRYSESMTSRFCVGLFLGFAAPLQKHVMIRSVRTLKSTSNKHSVYLRLGSPPQSSLQSLRPPPTLTRLQGPCRKRLMHAASCRMGFCFPTGSK